MPGWGRLPIWLSSPSTNARRSRRALFASWASSPCGNACASTGKLRNGPEFGTSDSQSLWWRVMDMAKANHDLCSISYSTFCQTDASIVVSPPNILHILSIVGRKHRLIHAVGQEQADLIAKAFRLD